MGFRMVHKYASSGQSIGSVYARPTRNELKQVLRREYMPLELGVWRIDKGLSKVETKALDQEKRLEDFLEEDISIVSPNWLVIGRQVLTDHGGWIDLLAMDDNANLVILELKKDKTPRDVVAQLLDYGSWAKALKYEDIAGIFVAYQKKLGNDGKAVPLDEAFKKRFAVSEMPDEVNESHQLVVVASSLDESTERIVTYLSEEYDVDINAIFFKVFSDADREYLTRTWFIDPMVPSVKVEVDQHEPWNGEYYVSFGHNEKGRRWEDAVKYGFVCAGGGRWYSGTLSQLEIGGRIWVNVPGSGYVGVGVVQEGPVRVKDFEVTDEKGASRRLREMNIIGTGIFANADDEEKSERLVRVEWLKTVQLDNAIKEKGLFGNQNSVCKPKTKKWRYTVERLKARFGME